MTGVQISKLKQVLGLLGRSRDRVPFFYCALGPEGSPVLLVDAETIDPMEIVALMRSALEPVFVRGEVVRNLETGMFLFVVSAGDVPRLVADLQGPLDRMAPGLRFANVTVSEGTTPRA